MSISVKCACGKNLHVPDHAAGKKVRCPACKAVVEVAPAGSATHISSQQPRRATPIAAKPARRLGSVTAPAPDEPVTKTRSIAPTLVVVGLVATFVCLLAGGGFAAYWFILRKPNATAQSSSSGSDEQSQHDRSLGLHEKYLPDDTKQITSRNFARIRSSALFAELKSKKSSSRRGLKPDIAELELVDDDVDRETVAMTPVFQTKFTLVRIVSLNRDFDLTDFAKQKKWKERKAGNQTLYAKRDDSEYWWTSPEKRVLIRGPVTDIEKISSHTKAPELRPSMKRLMDLADFSRCHVVLEDTTDSKGSGSGYLSQLEGMVFVSDITTEITDTVMMVFEDAQTAEVNMKELEDDMKKHTAKGTEQSISRVDSRIVGTQSTSAETARQDPAKHVGTFEP
jgi:flagellar basal body-associated protein FliL/phage FluMu protein Com